MSCDKQTVSNEPIGRQQYAIERLPSNWGKFLFSQHGYWGKQTSTREPPSQYQEWYPKSSNRRGRIWFCFWKVEHSERPK